MSVPAPLVSVLIGVYNAERYLGEAIESVLAQTYAPIELIVVDDGSTDGSGAVARAFGDRLVYDRQPRGGIGAARNRAVELSTGSHLAFLDADDRFEPRKIERQLAALADDPELDVVFGHMSEFVSADLPAEQAARLRAPVANAPWPTPNLMLVRRASFDRVGPYSTSLRVGVGVDWYARAVDLGLKLAVLPEVVLERRLHSSNNGLRESASRSQYLSVLKASIDRRRAQGEASSGPGG